MESLRETYQRISRSKNKKITEAEICEYLIKWHLRKCWCTVLVTKRADLTLWQGQDLWYCRTCDKDELCSTCIERCHPHHSVHKSPYGRIQCTCDNSDCKPNETDIYVEHVKPKYITVDDVFKDFIPVTKDDLDLIFSYLPGCDLATISQVNKTCFTLMMNNSLWKRAYELDFQEYAPGGSSKKLRETFRKLRQYRRKAEKGELTWKEMYIIRMNHISIRKSWRE